MDSVVNSWWFPKPKVLAALVVGGLVYVLGAFGVDLGVLLQDLSDVIGVDIPDPQALSVILAGLIAAWFKKEEVDYADDYEDEEYYDEF